MCRVSDASSMSGESDSGSCTDIDEMSETLLPPCTDIDEMSETLLPPCTDIDEMSETLIPPCTSDSILR